MSNVVWEKLSYPFSLGLTPLVINSDDVIVASVQYKASNRGIFKFNIKSKEWNKIIDLCFYSPYTFNKQDNTLYMVDDNMLQIVSLNQKHPTKAKIKLGSYFVSQIIYINNKLHSITHNTKHYTFNIETKESKMVYKFEEFQNGLEGAGLIYLKRPQSIILLGGYGDNYNGFNSIYEYSLLLNKW
eukprot:261657_1